MKYTYYAYSILLSNDSGASIEKLRILLENAYQNDSRKIEINLNNNKITLNINGWELYVKYSNEPSVLEESKKIADLYAKDKMDYSTISSCKARFEMSAMPDEFMEYFMEQTLVMNQIQSFSAVFIFDSNNPGFLNI